MSVIVAAGAVVSRKGRVLLVHRPVHDDWSFPKGKLDPQEHATAAAVREVAEETGLDIWLGPPLSMQSYVIQDGRPKQVHYWAGRLVHDDDVSTYRPNAEIDEVAWVPFDEAPARLTYKRDRRTLAEYLAVKRTSSPLVVVRHGKAHPRKSWHEDDRERPLSVVGELQAEVVVPVLASYGVQRVVSSTSRRCWTTVAPYADVAGLELEVTKALSEEDATETTVADVVVDLMRDGAAALCTHRPVLPLVYDALAIAPEKLESGDLLVAHHRRGRVIAVEHHSGASFM